MSISNGQKRGNGWVLEGYLNCYIKAMKPTYIWGAGHYGVEENIGLIEVLAQIRVGIGGLFTIFIS